MIKERVEFYSEGYLIKGLLYIPEKGEEQYPVIIMCHGFAGVKELLLPGYAEKFVNAGYMVLTFDYRGFGESEGVAGRLIPKEQIVDIRNAITYIETRTDTNSNRIGLWGTSLGGTNVISAAYEDKRVKCIAVQLTFGDGERVILGDKSEEDKNKILTTINKMWQKSVTQNRNMMIGIKKLLTDEQSKQFYDTYVEKFSQLKVKIPFLTMKEILEVKPEAIIDNLSIPIHITCAENDMVNPKIESVRLFEKAKEPKEFLVVENATHYEVYENEQLDVVANKQIEWFNKCQ